MIGTQYSTNTVGDGAGTSGSDMTPHIVSQTAISGPSVPTFSWTPSEVGVVKFIPKSARTACAINLAGVLQEIVKRPSALDKWLKVLNWAKDILALPVKGGKKTPLASVIIKRTSNDNISIPPIGDCTVTKTRQARHGSQSPQMLAKLISNKLEEGNVKGAVRILMSNDAVAPNTDATLNLLRAKHPQSLRPLVECTIPSSSSVLTVSEDEVRKSLGSFPVGSAGGPDGLSPLHLKTLIGNKVAGKDLLSALTGFTNALLAGSCPAPVVRCFLVVRLDKKNLDKSLR